MHINDATFNELSLSCPVFLLKSFSGFDLNTFHDITVLINCLLPLVTATLSMILLHAFMNTLYWQHAASLSNLSNIGNNFL